MQLVAMIDYCDIEEMLGTGFWFCALYLNMSASAPSFVVFRFSTSEALRTKHGMC